MMAHVIQERRRSMDVRMPQRTCMSLVVDMLLLMASKKLKAWQHVLDGGFERRKLVQADRLMKPPPHLHP